MFAQSFRHLFATPARFNPAEVAKQSRRRRKLFLVGGVGIAIATFNYKFKECIDVVGNPAGVQDPNKLFFARMFFGRLRSRIIGNLMEREIPVTMRQTIYGAYARATGVNMEEMRYPIDSFRTVQDFFTRSLKKDVRPMESTDPLCLVSPADSEVIAMGDVTSDRLPQVKGTTYSLKGFLGMDPTRHVGQGKSAPVLKYIVLYLCPGDYHRFHSPTKFRVTNAKHFTGEVLSVNKASLSLLNDVFSVNERVVLGGTWSQGNMWYTAVAAHGVGNMKLSFENKLRTNDARTVPVYCGGDVRNRSFDHELDFGEEVGMFKLGSTVVMIFDASKNMDWTVKEGDKVRVGQLLLKPSHSATA
jgi:phosphatidylserine decarboxylase